MVTDCYVTRKNKGKFSRFFHDGCVFFFFFHSFLLRFPNKMFIYCGKLEGKNRSRLNTHFLVDCERAELLWRVTLSNKHIVYAIDKFHFLIDDRRGCLFFGKKKKVFAW